MDQVLASARPQFTGKAAVGMAASAFGVAAAGARDLGSERDQTFGLHDPDGRLLAVLKVSNAAEDSAVLDMEAAAALHIGAADPGLTVALPWRTSQTGDPGPARIGDDPAALRARWPAGDGMHWLRLYDALPGSSRIEATALSDAALGAFGATAARLARALRGFGHPSAHRTMLWDVQHALATRSMLSDIRDPVARDAVARVLDEFERSALPAWPGLRAQVVHGDLTVDNTLTDSRGLVCGLIDFGDMSHTALITDLASVLDSLGTGRDGPELFRMGRLVLDGYQRHTELEEAELAVLGIAWAARSAVTIAISSWRAAQGLEDPAFAERYNAQCLAMIDTMERAGWPEVARQLGARSVGDVGGVRGMGGG
ncbi:MAG: phosphotransferase, partial [Solirubrobacteraceae bacterium]